VTHRKTIGQRLQEDAAAIYIWLGPGVAIALGAYFVLLAAFAPFTVSGDGVVYYDFTRRLLGDDVPGIAYQTGVGLWNAPFYLFGRLLGLPLGDQTDDTFVDPSITIAAALAMLMTLVAADRLLRELSLPRVTVIVFALLGTPLWYYGVYQPSYTHVVDALCLTVAAWLLVRVCRSEGEPTRTAPRSPVSSRRDMRTSQPFPVSYLAWASRVGGMVSARHSFRCLSPAQFSQLFQLLAPFPTEQSARLLSRARLAVQSREEELISSC
jgi:hypothetical protein